MKACTFSLCVWNRMRSLSSEELKATIEKLREGKLGEGRGKRRDVNILIISALETILERKRENGKWWHNDIRADFQKEVSVIGEAVGLNEKRMEMIFEEIKEEMFPGCAPAAG